MYLYTDAARLSPARPDNTKNGELELKPLVAPRPPMRGMYIDPFVAFGLQPAARDAAARKYKRVGPLGINDRQFKVNVEGCSKYGVPIHVQFSRNRSVA